MPSTTRVVPHPETGQPVQEVTTVDYVSIERNQLQEQVNNNQAALDQSERELGELRTQFEEQVNSKQQEVDERRRALEDSKSGLNTYDQIAPEPTTDTGTENPGGEGENQVAEGEVSVPVTVEQPQF